MKKEFYESPLCEVCKLESGETILQGSDFGAPGMPGSDFEILPGLNF